MAVQSIIDYIPVMDEFIAHWNATDATLIIADQGAAFTVEAFTGLRGDLDAAKTTLQGLLNDLENSRVVLELNRLSAGDRVAEFNRRIRADFPTNTTLNRLPTVPNRNGGRDSFLNAMDDVLDLWTRVNALPVTDLFAPPLFLMGGFTRANFVSLRAVVDAAFTIRSTADSAVAAQRIVRNEIQERAHALMVTYRLKIEAIYPPDSAAVATIPRLTPIPGSTPDPVTLTAVWDPIDLRAELSWTASDDPGLASYQIRAVPGPDYTAPDETLIATIDPGDPLTYDTAAGLALPGSAMSYKVYVRLTTGNEAGSNTQTVFRPT